MHIMYKLQDIWYDAEIFGPSLCKCLIHWENTRLCPDGVFLRHQKEGSDRHCLGLWTQTYFVGWMVWIAWRRPWSYSKPSSSWMKISWSKRTLNRQFLHWDMHARGLCTFTSGRMDQKQQKLFLSPTSAHMEHMDYEIT
jgi:hypothetical protein